MELATTRSRTRRRRRSWKNGISRHAIRRTFETRTSWAVAASGYRAVSVVTQNQAQSARRRIVSRVHTNGLRSPEKTSPPNVAMATHSENGKEEAKPQVRRWGFMNASQVQTSRPVHVRKKHNGSKPAMTMTRMMSRTGTRAEGEPES